MCTIAEILDWNGVWTRELVELMLPVAWEREVAAKRSMFEAQLAAAGSLFSKDAAKAFIDSLEKEQAGVRQLQLMSRGGETTNHNQTAARAAKAAKTLREGLGGFSKGAKPRRAGR